jgi:hypothetical protein
MADHDSSGSLHRVAGIAHDPRERWLVYCESQWVYDAIGLEMAYFHDLPRGCSLISQNGFGCIVPLAGLLFQNEGNTLLHSSVDRQPNSKITVAVQKI